MFPFRKIILILPVFFVAHIAQASCASGEYELLAPIGTLSGCVNLSDYLNGMFQTIIGIAGILAVVMIVICGIQLMASGSAGGKSEAKNCIWNAVFGVLLAVGSFIVLNTINPLLLKDTPPTLVTVSPTVPTPAGASGAVVAPFPTEPNWYFRYKETATGNVINSPGYANADTCQAQLKQKQNEAGNSIETNPLGKVDCWQVFAASKPLDASEGSVRTALCGNTSCVNQTPVGINGAACPSDGYAGSCTNVKGLPNSSVSAIIALKNACGGCSVMITGGTEYWKHSQNACQPSACHKPGDDVFDLRWDGDTTALANTIKSGNSPKPSFAGNTRWLYNNFWYTDEKSAVQHGGKRHWHVCKNGASASYCNP